MAAHGIICPVLVVHAFTEPSWDWGKDKLARRRWEFESKTMQISRAFFPGSAEFVYLIRNARFLLHIFRFPFCLPVWWGLLSISLSIFFFVIFLSFFIFSFFLSFSLSLSFILDLSLALSFSLTPWLLCICHYSVSMRPCVPNSLCGEQSSVSP